MNDISSVIRKFERMMGHSYDELMEMGRHSEAIIPSKSDVEVIGTFTYDFEKETEKFTPTLKYRIRSSFNRFYSHLYSYFRHKKN